MPANPVGADWRTTRSCPICWSTFAPAGPRHRYCSDKCRKAGHQRRQNHSATQAARPSQAPTPVASRACPHCGEQVSIVALLTTPEVARPAIPDPSVVPLRRA
jgi:endogenous inhibitor of DNA gyrase (YacG/DUF329 family)